MIKKNLADYFKSEEIVEAKKLNNNKKVKQKYFSQMLRDPVEIDKHWIANYVFDDMSFRKCSWTWDD